VNHSGIFEWFGMVVLHLIERR